MMAHKRSSLLVILWMVLTGTILSLALPAAAYAEHKTKHAAHHSRHRHYSHAVFARPLPASFVVDATTGKVLEEENADAPRYPASLTKMMTLYLTFEALKKGTLRFDETIPVSEHASSMPQTNIALQPGDHIAVKDAVLSIVVRSANDSAVALAEALGGTESQFAEKMTAKARSLGMKNTNFHNGSGLPDPLQRTTARDMAKLGLALRTNFPQYFPLFKSESFTYHGVTYVTHNHVMTRYDGVDGIKTGFIRASGFNVVTSANRGDHHLIAVVMGGPTWKARDDKMIALLDHTFYQLASAEGKKGVQTASLQSHERPAKEASVYPATAEGEGDLAGDDMQVSANSRNWGVMVGSFAHAKEAAAAATSTMKQVPDVLAGASVKVANEKSNSSYIYHAELDNLLQQQAETACHKLMALHEPCSVYRAN
jgi:D-alanyl-D-alanine carboxypeptidase